MAYVNVADWKAEQVAEWLKGLDSVVLQYIRLFVEKGINGQQLLDLQPNDLEDIGVSKIGHQEIILEAIDLLKNFYYDLDRENLQLLALRLSCLSHSLLNELWKNHMNSSVVSTQVLADVANVVSAVKPLVCWLDRNPFCEQLSYVDKKSELSKLSVEMAMSGMRDKFAEKPIDNIRQSCKQLAELADSFIQGIDDSLLLQPASLDLATLKKRPGDHLGFYIVPSFHGILQVGELKCNSAAHQCGKIETGDEIVQINYQTVVGWEVKEVMSLLFEESSTEVLMTLKKRPRHSKVFGQIYIKPYRLPCKKQMSYSTKWNDLLSPTRPELLSVPAHFGWPFRTISVKPTTVSVKENPETKPPPSPTPSTVSSISSRSSESELMVGPSSPNSVRLYLPKPRIPVQRRATITGASPVSKHAPLSLEQFWHELKLEREWRSNSDEKTEKANSETQLKRSVPTSHCSLNWSARLCEQSPDSSKSNISVAPENGSKLDKEHTNEENGIIPLKQRIDCLNRAIEQTGVKKPKLLPKPILSSKTPLKSDGPMTPFHAPGTLKESEIGSRRERGKLDKSYSTPSYDYSIDSKEPLMFNMKLPEEKVKSAPDNITAEVVHKSDFKKLELTTPLVVDQHRATPPPIKLEQIEEHDHLGGEQATPCNEYSEIKTEESPVSKREMSDERVNQIVNTIESTLKIDNESDVSSPSSTKEEARNVNAYNKTPNYFTFEHSSIMPYTSSSSKLDTDSLRLEDVSSIATDTLRSNVSDLSQPPERLHIHTTINVNVPATFPRHKMENKKGFPPPEPPPRPAKGSPLHSKFSKSSAVTKSSVKSPPHKSPKVTRKKNVWLTKRRNVSVKDLGVCDHEGWLYHRSRKMARGSPQWIKGWFIIKGTIFYGFNSREAAHARLMISLPGFTVSPAEEVKSRNFSFKVYHTGTTFYFAAESGEDLHGWVESFSRVTVSDEEQSIVVSETDGEEDNDTPTTKKDKSSGESTSSHLAAMKKLSGLITGHLSGMQDSKSSDKKFNSLKKVSSSRKASKEEQQSHENNSHSASLDRKYLKFFGGRSTQNFNPVPTAQFRSYRRVPPMEKPPFGAAESTNLADSNTPDMLPVVPILSASPTRPPDMADYRLASLAKCPNPRTLENAHPGGYMTLESFMLSRQEEERRLQSQHPRATNILRAPQCQAPPPPTPLIPHNVVAVTGHEQSSVHPISRPPAGPSTSAGKNWPEHSSHAVHKSGDATSASDVRPKYLKKTTQYQPPPWDSPVHRLNEDVRLQPAFEMTLDRQPTNENVTNNTKTKKTDVSSSSSLRFKNLFSSSKSDTQKTNLISSPRLRRVLFRDKKNSSQAASPTNSTHENVGLGSSINNAPLVATHPPEIRLPNAPDYPGLQYPPIFEPGSYSLSDVSSYLRSFDHGDNTMARSENFELGLEQRIGDCVNNNNNNNNNNNDNNAVITSTSSTITTTSTATSTNNNNQFENSDRDENQNLDVENDSVPEFSFTIV